MICPYTGTTPPTPVIEVNVSEQFENNSINVTVQWAVENGAFDSLSVVPQTETINIGASIRQMIISYNMIYNVTATASLCGQYSSHSIELYYGELLQYAIVLLWIYSIHYSSVHFPASSV